MGRGGPEGLPVTSAGDGGLSTRAQTFLGWLGAASAWEAMRPTDAIGLGASQWGSRAPGVSERGSSTAAVSDNQPAGLDQLGDELTPGLYCLTDVVRKKQRLKVQSNGPYHHSDLHEATSEQDNPAAGVVYWRMKVQVLERGPDANEALQLTRQSTSPL